MQPTLNRDDLPEVEKQELIRILDLPKANRPASPEDIKFLKERVDYIDDEELRPFGLEKPTEAPPEKPKKKPTRKSRKKQK